MEPPPNDPPPLLALSPEALGEELAALDLAVRKMQTMQRQGVERDSLVMRVVAEIPRLTQALREALAREAAAVDGAFAACESRAAGLANRWAEGKRKRGWGSELLTGLGAVEEVTGEIRTLREAAKAEGTPR